MRALFTLASALTFAGPALAQTPVAAPAPAVAAADAALPASALAATPPTPAAEPLPTLIQAGPVETGPVPLTPLEMEACRRIKQESVEGPKPTTAQAVGGTAGAVAGQVAGAAVAGPVGAAVGAVVVGTVSKTLAGAAGKALSKDEKDRSKPKPGQPDPLLLAECDQRAPASLVPAPQTARK
jgi:phage tail tape-measure protein